MSPRNSKHSYLLKGLVRCGGCQGAYVGDPDRHGFSYRCVNRCKRYPSIREGSLDSTVWDAVKRSLKEPETIVAGIRSIEDSDRSHLATERDHDKTALKQIQAEEARVLEAYRLGFLTADQLGTELKGLKARMTLIESHMREQQGAGDISSTRRPLQDFCKLVSERLDVANWAAKRQILMHLLTKISFEGELVRISGRIALPPDAGNSGTASSDNPGGRGDLPIQQYPGADNSSDTTTDRCRNDDRIAATTSWDCGRNSVEASESASIVTFELVTHLFRDQTALVAARTANLAKANSERRRHPSETNQCRLRRNHQDLSRANGRD